MQKNNLSKFFPMIRTREQILSEIMGNKKLRATYEGWRLDQQERFLDICSGVRGCKLLYDSYVKEILNPETTPERLSKLLSIILGRKVKVKYALPNDNSRIGDEMSLVITDIVVELEDGSIANIEVQKIGLAFTGERASCYTADLLLRQYKRVRDERKEKFSYKDICPVYTIIFMEDSPSEFKEFKNKFIHTFTSKSDSNIKLNMLQNIIFIPIDNYLEKLHNKNRIDGEFEAWLTFLGCDEPEYIIKLIEEYPYFKPMYEDLYNMCLNVERVMEMFSEELRILDRNTVKYMIDELQDKLDDTMAALDSATEELNSKTEELNSKTEELNSKTEELNSKTEELNSANATIAQNKELIESLMAKIKALENEKK